MGVVQPPGPSHRSLTGPADGAQLALAKQRAALAYAGRYKGARRLDGGARGVAARLAAELFALGAVTPGEPSATRDRGLTRTTIAALASGSDRAVGVGLAGRIADPRVGDGGERARRGGGGGGRDRGGVRCSSGRRSRSPRLGRGEVQRCAREGARGWLARRVLRPAGHGQEREGPEQARCESEHGPLVAFSEREGW
jgi:hypothetical protein